MFTARPGLRYMSSVPTATDVPRTSLAVAESALARADGGDLDGAVAELRAHLAAGLVRVVPALDLVVRRSFHWALPPGAIAGTAARFHNFAVRTPPSLQR